MGILSTPQGRAAWITHYYYGGGGGTVYEPEASALFQRGNFTGDEKAIINEAIQKLKNDSQWNHIFECKVYGVSSEFNSLLDWRNELYNAEKVGNPVFEPYNGWTGTGNTTDYIRSHFNPNGVINQNNVIVIAWELSILASNSILYGCQDEGNEGILLIPKSSSNTAISRLISDANDSVTQNGSPVGYWTTERKLSTEYKVYIAQTLKATHSKVSTAVPNLEIYDLVSNNNGTPGNAGTRQIGGRIVASGNADYTKIADAINDCLVRLNALSI